MGGGNSMDSQDAKFASLNLGRKAGVQHCCAGRGARGAAWTEYLCSNVAAGFGPGQTDQTVAAAPGDMGLLRERSIRVNETVIRGVFHYRRMARPRPAVFDGAQCKRD